MNMKQDKNVPMHGRRAIILPVAQFRHWAVDKLTSTVVTERDDEDTQIDAFILSVLVRLIDEFAQSVLANGLYLDQDLPAQTHEQLKQIFKKMGQQRGEDRN